MRQVDPVRQGPLGGALQLDVEREAQRVSRLRPGLHPRRRLRAAPRVDRQLRLAVSASQVAVVCGLDSGLPDRVVRLVAAATQPLVLLRRDLADVAEHLRSERLVRVLPQLALREMNAREVGGVLGQVVDLVVVQPELDDHGRQRVGRVLAQRLQHVADAHAGDHRQRAELRALGRPVLRQVGGPQLDARPRHVAHEHVPVAIEDRAARRLQAERAHAIVVRLREVAVAGQHLQRPEPQEQRGEDGERQEAEHGDAERQLGREPVRLLDPRVAGEEASARGVRASQGAAPPRRGRRAGAAGRAGVRVRTPAPSGAG